MLFSAFVILLITYGLFTYYKRFLKVQQLEKIPGPVSLPLIGNAIDLSGSPSELFKAFNGFCFNHGDGICRMYIGLQPYVLLFKARQVETLLSSNQTLDKSGDYFYMEPWLGSGLVTANVQKWRPRRKLLTPAFHFKILDNFIEVFHNKSMVLVDKLEKISGKGDTDIFPNVALCTLDIIFEAAMGVQSNHQNDSQNEYVVAISKISKMMQKRSASPHLQHDFLFRLFGYEKKQNDMLKVLHGTALSAIRQRREEFENQKALNKEEKQEVTGMKKRLAFLDILLEQADVPGNNLTDEDIREEVDTVMFAGHDSTASGISFTLYWLAKHPDIQERVFQEIQEVLDTDEVITAAHVREFKYLECCIKESFRLTPPVPLTGRVFKQDAVIDGYNIPAGTNVLVMYYCLHRDPEYFPDPEKYDPDRFASDASTDRHPYAFVPFSAGPRNCIGQKFAMNEEKVVIANVIRNFRLTTKQSFEDMKLNGAIVLGTENGIILSIEKRK